MIGVVRGAHPHLAPWARPWYNANGMCSVRSLGGLLALLMLTALVLDLDRDRAEAQADAPADAQPGAPPPDAASAPPVEPPADGATPADAASAEATTPRPVGPVRRLIVIDAATYGVDPVVGRVATDRMRRTAEEMGYQVLSPTDTVAAAQRLRMPYPPAPADLWRVTWVAEAQRGAFARVWASEGRYVIEMMVASLDGAGPFFARETAGADDLRDVIDRMTRQTLPPPTQWQEQAQAAAGPATRVRRARPREELAHPGGIGVRLPEPPIRRWAVTLQTEAVFGTTQGGFYNHLVGARLDFRVTRDLIFGAYVGYTNLQGRNDRAHNLLLMIQGEQRVRLGPSIDLTIPLRIAVGYLPFNGPVIRLSAGLNYPISENFEIGVDLVTPTFWVLADDFAVSLDVALEATYRLP